jgi:ArsR family transcriptional regulator
MKSSPHDQRCERLGEFFGIFAHAARMKIFCCLQYGPRSVSQIARETGITLPNASQHLRLMREQGAVDRKRSGRSIYYHLADSRFIEAANMVADALAQSGKGAMKCTFTDTPRMKYKK